MPTKISELSDISRMTGNSYFPVVKADGQPTTKAKISDVKKVVASGMIV